jgi:hypothetical protein
MKVGDFVRTGHGATGIIVEYHPKWDNCSGGYPWYVWMTGTEEVHYFQTEHLELISESR